MSDKEVEYEIRKSLHKHLPDIVFQVSYADKHLHVDFLGGNSGNSYIDISKELKDRVMEAVWEVYPNIDLWFDF